MNLCLFLHFFLSAFPILILTDEFTPFYQSTVTNLSEWNFTNVNSTINNNTCKVGNSFFEIIGGALNFNYNTILTKLCQTKQKTAAFYRMKLFMMVYLPNSNFNRNYSGYNIQISLNETKFLHFYLNETSNENKQCTNLVYSNQYSLIPLYIDISLSNYNLSSFSMGINLNFSSKYDNNYYYPWGFSNLTVELYECDSSLCSSCNILPRNCSVFCSIQCKSCSYLNPKKCTSCYSPNILNPNGECESTSI